MRLLLLLSIVFVFIAPLQARSVIEFSPDRALTIIHPSKPTPAELTSCRELQEYLQRMVKGAACQIIPEGQASSAPKQAIYVGETAFAIKSGINFDHLDAEEWILKTTGQNLVLAGGRPRGTFYAVLEFLDLQGVVWPDEVTTYVPEKQKIVIGDMNIQGKPGITFRRITLGLSPNATTRRFLAHNRYNDKSLPEEYGGGYEMGGCHTFHDFTSPDWPDEYFSLNSGKRTRSINGGGPGQLCMTNPDMQKDVLKKMLKKIADDRAVLPKERWPKIYDLSQHDNDAYCHCERCMGVFKREGAYSGVLLEFINFVAKGVAQRYPDVFIQTFAYSHSQKPPLHIKPEPNVLIRLCKLGLECYPGGKCDTMVPASHPRNKEFLSDFNNWRAISKQMAIWDYWVIYTGNPFPYINVKSIAEDIAFYHANGVNNMLVESEGADKASFAAFKQWIGYRLMVHPDLDLATETAKFFNAYFGPAAAPMLAYYNYLTERMAAADVALVQTGALSIPYLDRSFFEKSNALLDKAEELCAGNAAALQRVGFERISVDGALLNMRSLFTGALPTGKAMTLEALYERLRKNWLSHSAYYFHDGNACAPRSLDYTPTVRALDAKKKAYLSQEQHLPAQFSNRKVVDLNWSYGNTKLIVEDPDGLWGCSVRHPDGARYYKVPFEMGIFERFKNRQLVKKTLTAKDIAQDEKFHLYSLGKYTLPPGCQLWMNWSWLLSMMIDQAYIPGGNNTYEVYVSLKFTGEPFVKGSKTTPGIYYDRVLLVQ